MSDEAPANPAAPAPEAGSTPAPAQNPDDVLRAAVAALDKPQAEEPKAEPAVEKPAEPAAPPAEEKPPEAAKPEPSAAEARKVLAQAEKKLAEAKATTESALRDIALEMRRSPRSALAKLAKLAGGQFDLEDVIDADIADTTVRETGKPESEAPAGDEKLTELDKRLAAIEQREHDAKVATRIAEIHSDIAKDTRFPTIQARGKAGLVTKLMLRYHEKNGTPIAWDKAAQIVEDDLRSLAGGAPPKPTPAAALAATAVKPAESPRQPTLAGEGRDYVPPDESQIPKDPDKAIEFLVKHAYAQAGRSAS